MANSSYLYLIDFNPSNKQKADDDEILGLSEWAYGIPIVYKIILSSNPQLCKSIIWDYKQPISIISDFNTGKKKLFNFFDELIKSELFPGDKLINEIENAKIFLNEESGQFNHLFLEGGEIFEMDEDITILKQAKYLLAEIKNMDKTISDFFSSIKEINAEQKKKEKELAEFLGLPNDQLSQKDSEKKKKKWKKAIKDLEDQKWDQLGINNWSRILYYDL